jgi:hypothetical protein
MGYPDRECPVFIFHRCWRGRWASEYFRVSSSEISAQIFAFQAFSPANIIFAGIGALLLVGVLHGSLT